MEQTILLTTRAGWSVTVLAKGDPTFSTLMPDLDRLPDELELTGAVAHILETQWPRYLNLVERMDQLGCVVAPRVEDSDYDDYASDDYIDNGTDREPTSYSMEDRCPLEGESKTLAQAPQAIVVIYSRLYHSYYDLSDSPYYASRYLVASSGETSTYYPIRSIFSDNNRRIVKLQEILELSYLIVIPKRWRLFVVVDRDTPKEERMNHYYEVGEVVKNLAEVGHLWRAFEIVTCGMGDLLYQLGMTTSSWGIMWNAAIRDIRDHQECDVDRPRRMVEAGQNLFPLDWCGVVWEDAFDAIAYDHEKVGANDQSRESRCDREAARAWLTGQATPNDPTPRELESSSGDDVLRPLFHRPLEKDQSLWSIYIQSMAPKQYTETLRTIFLKQGTQTHSNGLLRALLSMRRDGSWQDTCDQIQALGLPTVRWMADALEECQDLPIYNMANSIIKRSRQNHIV
jgi:hypothetical protein